MWEHDLCIGVTERFVANANYDFRRFVYPISLEIVVSLKNIAKTIVGNVAPGILNDRYIAFGTPKEAEINLLPALISPGTLAIDVGANRGLYVHHLLRLGANVVAFEPLPDMRRWLGRNYGKRLRIEPYALSDSTGEAKIRFPRGNPSWATIADTNHLEKADAGLLDELTIEMRTLDSFGFENVGLVKIDVEGNEEAVLAGATSLLATRPPMVIESEDRHNPGSPVRLREFMRTHGYAGLFLEDGRIGSMDDFNVARDQPVDNVGSAGKSGRYINNFVFVPQERAAALTAEFETIVRQ